MLQPGPRNSITDIAGLKIGNAEDTLVRTGVTVVLPDRPVVAAVDVRGGGTGTRELELMDPSASVNEIHAIVLSGGSAFGLDAAGGVTVALAAQGRGFAMGDHVVPIVPSAILFDLWNGGKKSWGMNPPYRALGIAAVESATEDFSLGNAGAGYGAKAGPLKGGLGTASVKDPVTGCMIGAIAAVNSFGSVTLPDSDCFWAWPFEMNKEFGETPPPQGRPLNLDYDFRISSKAPTHTTLAVVATDAALDKASMQRIAIMAQDGLARAIRPVHSTLDGDVVFALTTGVRSVEKPLETVARLGSLAADCLARAIARGAYEAKDLGQMTSYRRMFRK